MAQEKLVDLLSARDLFSGDARQASLKDVFNLFLAVEMLGRSSQTKLWYLRCLNPLIERIGPDRPISDVMDVDVLDWYQGLEHRSVRYPGGGPRPELQGELSKESLRGYVRAARRFFRWIQKRGILGVDLSADLHPPRKPRRGKKGISETNAGAILAAAKESPRDYAILKFMETAGVRREGVANLLLSDLNLDAESDRLRRRITVREKGDKERTVIVTESGLQAILDWLAVRPKVGDPHVFLGQRPGRPWYPLSEAGISAILRRYKVLLELDGPVSPHQWRHRFCRKRLQDGMNLKQVSQLAGHESITVTAEFYSEFAIDELQDAYDEHYRDGQG